MFGETLEFESTLEAQNNEEAVVDENNAADDPAVAGDNSVAENNATENENGTEGAVNDAGNGTEGSFEDTSDYIEVSFGEEVRSLNRDEATYYAQRGIELDQVYQELDYIATTQGLTVDEFLKAQRDARETAYRQQLETRVTDEEAIEDLMNLYRSKEDEKYEQAKLGRKKAEEAERQSRESRIADDFIKLQKEFPEVKDFKSLPASVKQAAANGKDLLAEFLLYQHREGQAVKKAEETAKAAAAASGGSVKSANVDENADRLAAFIKEFNKY